MLTSLVYHVPIPVTVLVSGLVIPVTAWCFRAKTMPSSSSHSQHLTEHQEGRCLPVNYVLNKRLITPPPRL